MIMESFKKTCRYHKIFLTNISNSYFRSQIKLLIRERQDNLTHEFKRSLEKVNTLSSAAQNKERRFWECVIQGNISDMETSSYAAKKAITETEFEITHLLREYQNNQHVARATAKYLLKVKGDKIGYSV